MNRNYLCYTFLLLVIVVCLYNSSTNQRREGFTPGIRRLIRPHVRNARLFSEKFFTNSNNTLNTFLRKVGLY